MVNNTAHTLDLVFSALSDPTRRAMISRLAKGSVTVSELAEPFAISLPAASKHLNVLERAGLLVRTTEGRVRHCTLRAEPLEEASEWIARNRAMWEHSLDALEEYLKSTTGEHE